MKTLKILFLLLTIAFACISAQSIHNNNLENNFFNSTPQELLKSKKWNIMGKSVDIFYEFTDTEELLIVEGTVIGRSRYYFSNQNCYQKSFNSSKIGQVNNGRFLFSEENNSCFYITIINDSTVQLSYLSEENPVTTTLIAKK